MDNKTKALILDIQSVLTPDLLSGQYAKTMPKTATEGHCYAASEALYHLLGGKEEGYIPCVASFDENGIRCTHWWLKSKTGEILDPTAEQFTALGYEPPYKLGKGSGFLTKNPSKRAEIIISRVKNLHLNLENNQTLSI